MNTTAFLIAHINTALSARGVSVNYNDLELALTLRVQRSRSLEAVIGGSLAELLLPADYEIGFTNDLIDSVLHRVLVACFNRALTFDA